MRVLLAANLLIAVAAGCVPRPVIEPAPGGAVVKGARVGLYTKEVMTKKDPDTFIANDGTFCRVPEDRFKATALHTLVYCNWQ